LASSGGELHGDASILLGPYERQRARRNLSSAALTVRPTSSSATKMKALCDIGFFTRDNKWYSLVDGMKVNVVEA
jgi:hypothetical protein